MEPRHHFVPDASNHLSFLESGAFLRLWLEGVVVSACLPLRILVNHWQGGMVAHRIVIMGLQSSLLRVQDLQIWPNMLLGKPLFYYNNQEREIKGLCEITSKLMAESGLQFKCPDTQPEVFAMLVSSTSHSIISTFLSTYLPVCLSYHSPFYLSLYLPISF